MDSGERQCHVVNEQLPNLGMSKREFCGAPHWAQSSVAAAQAWFWVHSLVA